MTLRRDIAPVIRPVELIKIPEAELFKLNNGIPVYLIITGSEELMRVEFIFDAGQVREDFPLVASLTNAMLLEGSANYTANEINSAFDFYGAFINPFIQKDIAGVTVFLLNKHIDKILELCNEILSRPQFPDDELNNLQRKRLQLFLLNKKKVQNIAYDKFFESVFGRSHPYGKRVHEPDFGKVTATMVQNFHKEFYRAGNMAVIISGKIPDRVKELLNIFFGEIKNDPVKSSRISELKIAGNRNKREYVEKRGAVQSAIRIGSATINKKHKDFNGLLILDTILGGYFGSRLMKNIREEKGYTYGISSSVVSMQQSGYKIIATEVGKKYTHETLNEIYKEIRSLQTRPVGLHELHVARRYLEGEMVRMFDGPFALAESFRAVWEFGLDNNYYYNLAEKIRTIEPDEIITLANTYYNIDDLYEIIAGPKL
jgi:zinc protease